MILSLLFLLACSPFVQTHRLHCQEPWFHLLRSNEKTIEGRLNRGAAGEILEGDQIEFYNCEESFVLRVTQVQHFATLRSYLESVGLASALPGVQSIEEGCKVYLQFYSEEEIEKFGIAAFTVESL